ncbi:metallophosphoesterase [Filibacter tadaridae]|uniref:Putative metallophosphoesterase n=1 Tax=Filibacter tadaridae TaxID=2483811 RepID=A0A3P5WYN3_9BACL|nr:metallophosphoesterase [Filibacter tadaridae]VDC26662.1 putative metallophosphoesterase [Filibacter tadaridae]
MRKWLLILLVVCFIGFFIYKGNTTIGVTHYEIMSEKVPESFNNYRIVQLSDLHDAKFGERHAGVVGKVKDVEPDVIFVTGDFIDSNRYDLKQSLILIEELQSVAPIYYVTGNHEIAVKDVDTIKTALKELGVHVLTDEAKIIRTASGDELAIGGIEDPLASELEDDEAVKASISQAFQEVPPHMFKLLLSHRPELFAVYSQNEIDVTFSGHAHGGQFRIPGLGGLLSPGQGWFPKYTAGIHELNNSRMVISRGIGNSIMPIRLFNQPEIVVVTLLSEE